MKFHKLRFLTAGIPLSSAQRSTLSGLERLHELGLDGMEMEFVRGVRMSRELAVKVADKSSSLGLILTAHAPYYINLNTDQKKIENTYQYLLETARALENTKGWSMVFHPGYYHQMDKKEAYSRIKKRLRHFISLVKKEAFKIWIRPETMGKVSQFGTVEELIRLSQETDRQVMPCFDFSHIHARSAANNSYEEWERILSLIGKELGERALHNMHIHYNGIQYGPKGEIRHLILDKSDARYRELLTVLRDFDVAGVLVCESPNVEEDTLRLKEYYEVIAT